MKKTQEDLVTAEHTTQQQQETAARAEQQEQVALNALEEDRRRHEVEHLRITLHVGDPRPVCQALVYELPPLAHAAQTDGSTLQRAYDTAKATARQARQALQKTEATIAALRAQKETAEQELTERARKRQDAQQRFITRFPGFSSLAAALSALQTQRQEIATVLNALEVKVQAAEKEKLTLARQREKTQQEEAKLSEAVRRIAGQLETGSAQVTVLDQALASYLSDGNDPEAVLTARRQTLRQAEQEARTLEQGMRKEENALSTLQTKKLQAEGQHGVLTSERSAAVARAEREARAARENLDLSSDASLPGLVDLERELGELTRKQEQYTALLKREESLDKERERAERQAVELRADLQARERMLQEVRQALTQAEKFLIEARTEFQAAVRASGLSDLGPDGEGLKERLNVIRGQLSVLMGFDDQNR